jgi:membrane protein required for beta-lactamase induction
MTNEDFVRIADNTSDGLGGDERALSQSAHRHQGWTQQAASEEPRTARVYRQEMGVKNSSMSVMAILQQQSAGVWFAWPTVTSAMHICHYTH